MKRASSRSHRGSKGIKVKHEIQICVLLGVCIWLIYQVKYSHDKKHQFYEKIGKKLSEDAVKLGRKDLLPRYHDQKENEKHVGEDEEEISHGGEVKEKKSIVKDGKEDEKEEEDEEEDEEEKNKQEEEEEVADKDEIDEQDQTDKDDELLEEDKDKTVDEVRKEHYKDDKASSAVEEVAEKDEIDEQDHTAKDDELLGEEKDMAVDDVHEEHYKADDASSAVSLESRIVDTEELKESFGSSNETTHGTMNKVESLKEPDLKIGEATSAESLNKTTTEVKDGDNGSPSSDTVIGNLTEAIHEASGILQNETEIMRDRSQEDVAPPAGITDVQSGSKLEQTSTESDPNVTVSANITDKDFIQDESRNSTSKSSLIENISVSKITELKEKTRSEGEDVSGEKESSNLFSSEEAYETSETSISDGSSH